LEARKNGGGVVFPHDFREVKTNKRQNWRQKMKKIGHFFQVGVEASGKNLVMGLPFF
jgi:hypothetical protein